MSVNFGNIPIAQRSQTSNLQCSLLVSLRMEKRRFSRNPQTQHARRRRICVLMRPIEQHLLRPAVLCPSALVKFSFLVATSHCIGIPTRELMTNVLSAVSSVARDVLNTNELPSAKAIGCYHTHQKCT